MRLTRWRPALPNGTVFYLLLLEPLVPRGHIATIHNPGLGDIILAIRLRLLLGLRLLRPLDSGTRLRRPGLCVEGYSIGLVPPDGDAVAIPVFENIVRLEKLVIPLVPFVVRGIVEDNCLRRLTRFNRSFE
jgi:hypothetical protein